MEVKVLGAGQDIGRSCAVVTIHNRAIMFDCGMHMGHTDARKFPEFSLLGPPPYTGVIDCVLITHFHMDHCGGLPYFTERYNYNGPIYMTPPTKAVLPILLKDYCKVYSSNKERQRNKYTYTEEDISKCMKKTQTISIYETVEIEPGFTITAYYAGHVLGAVMFHVQVGDESVVYTGDYNMAPDKHLDAGWLPKLRPSLLITECTYAQLVGDCRKEREREFIESVVECVKKGGKVLIPVFALGRAHELCLLLDTYWDRVGLEIPIYTSATLTHKANEIYKQFTDYTHEHIRNSMRKRNLFNFKHVKQFEPGYANSDDAMVLFSSPGMLHSGSSLSVFKKWCGDPKNLIIFPGYCVRGTTGEKVLNGAKKIESGGITYPVQMQVRNMPFSAHADQKGILSLIQQCSPSRIVLMHGDPNRMKRLQQLVEKKMGIPTIYPPTGSIFTLSPTTTANVIIARDALQTLRKKKNQQQEGIFCVQIDKKNGIPYLGVLECTANISYESSLEECAP